MTKQISAVTLLYR